MALAGKDVVVRCADTDASGDEIDGINNIDWGPAADLLEVTDFADTTGYRDRILGLKDLSVTLSGDYESGDTGQARLRTNWASGASIFLRFLPNGSTGFKCEMMAESFNISASFDGKVEFSCSLKAVGAIGTV
jgi:predicted secreted protein